MQTMTVPAGSIAEARTHVEAFVVAVGLDKWRAAESPDGRKILAAVMQYACASFDLIVAADEALPAGGTEATELLQSWLAAAQQIETASAADAHPLAGEFLRRLAEARWILASAAKALSHPRIVDARDAAIDELRGRDGR
jgi:hypothetical protein